MRKKGQPFGGGAGDQKVAAREPSLLHWGGGKTWGGEESRATDLYYLVGNVAVLKQAREVPIS